MNPNGAVNNSGRDGDHLVTEIEALVREKMVKLILFLLSSH